MRQLPRKRSARQELVIKAVEDFCGDDGTPNPSITKIALWLMRRKRGVTLDENEKYILWYVENNLADPEYCLSLTLE